MAFLRTIPALNSSNVRISAPLSKQSGEAAAHMPMPTFIIIGAPKTGTSSIFNYVGQHPDAFTSTPKEPCFFLFDRAVPKFAGPGDDTFYSTTIGDIAQYSALFEKAGCKKAIGEASTLYLQHEDTPRRIFTHLPEVKLIVLLRNPVERAYSHYIMHRLQNREPESFARALDLENMRRAQNWAADWQYTGNGFYHEHIQRYLTLFPKDQLLIKLYDDFERDPVRFMSEIFRFLEIDDSFVPAMNTRYNITGLPRSPAIRFLLTSRHPVRQALKGLIPHTIRSHARNRLRQRYLTKPAMPADCRTRLETLYRPDIHRLEHLLDRSLAHWFTEQADNAPVDRSDPRLVSA